jgi:hypothetical protein
MNSTPNPPNSHVAPRSRAEPSGTRLSDDDVALVKAMLARGDRQHDVAAYFGVNAGRIAEIATGKQFRRIRVASAAEIPPPGPYLRPCAARAARDALTLAREAINRVEKLISQTTT